MGGLNLTILPICIVLQSALAKTKYHRLSAMYCRSSYNVEKDPDMKFDEEFFSFGWTMDLSGMVDLNIEIDSQKIEFVFDFVKYTPEQKLLLSCALKFFPLSVILHCSKLW